MKAQLVLAFIIIAAAVSVARVDAQPVDCSTLKGHPAKVCAVEQLREITKADRQFKRDLRKAFESLTKKGGNGK